jgi:predicted transcriptional regulator of viral defense system
LSQKRNKMTFQEFRTTFKAYPLISIVEIEKLFPAFQRKNLAYWQERRLLQKVRNSWYYFTENELTEKNLYLIANHIYNPSYVSLESALSFYGFIPEGVFKITSISTLKTAYFNSEIGNFTYQNVKPNLFFGYKLLSYQQFNIKIAEPEKAILDYLYLHPEVKSDNELYELRLNMHEIKQQINVEILQNYCTFIGSKSLSNRVKTFIKFIENQ